MRFLVDENLSRALVTAMRAEGWDVDWIVELAPSVSDDVVIQIAIRSNRVLLTSDIELASRTLWEAQSNVATLLLRLDSLDAQTVAELVTSTLKQRTDWEHLHCVLTPQKLRTRPKLSLLM
jgi:predicted nuclease of predicted toxin-antitoxin system